MKIIGYLVVTPLYNWSRNKVTGGKITAVRQSKPTTLSEGARAVKIILDVADDFFDYVPEVRGVVITTDDLTSVTAEES